MEHLFTPPSRLHLRNRNLQRSQSDSQKSALAITFHYRSDACDTWQIPDLQGRFTIVWVKSGSLGVIEHGHQRIVTGSRLLCLLPGHQLDLLSGHKVEAFLVSVSEDFVLIAGGQETYPFSMHYAYHHVACPVIKTGGEMQESIANVMNLVIRNIETRFNYATEVFKGFLQILSVYFLRDGEITSCPQAIPGGDEKLFSEFIKLLDVNYVTKKSVNEYAIALAVSPGYLSDAIKRVSGFTASFHIHQRVIRAAKKAAAGSRASMKEVAYQVGFTDIAHFSKFFRTQTGINFSDYKKLMV
ncbi:helix-turn-helix domain-containing protein [Dyadobacter sp. CY343]|uniref:helix-turn-helix domain-containing protein n=1 Tax=Dyadobacter sp. CY343 TaxID=2907299 RepID=UPI001F3AA34C|nr:helix-turn-helix domain-containing protein [Dyadobacter sp. CY343]MCE7060224.1 helix-turn-helix domain-containing protein [Dyadobacter sp. CY343]